MKMMKVVSLGIILTLFLGVNQNINAQSKKKRGKRGHKNELVKKNSPKKSKKQSYKEIMKGKHTTSKGVITIHKFEKDNKLYFELPLSLKGKDFLLASTISSTSDNGEGIVGQKPHKPIHFRFTFENNRVQIVTPSTNYVESDENNIRKAINNSDINPIYKSFNIEAYNSDSTAVLINVNDLFVSEDKDIDPFYKNSKNTYSGRAKRKVKLVKEDSYIKSVKAFDDNVTIKSKLAFKTSMTIMRYKLYEDKPFLAEVTRTILKLPEEPMRVRYADPRINIFFNYKTEFSPEAKGSEYKFFTNRWRLEPKNVEAWKRGGIVEPVKPIVFYVDSNYPENWKKYVLAGVEEWQRAFEAIGFKNAIIAKPFPTKEEDPDFDPDNLKYSCLRYAPTEVPNSMGPSWIDPRSGEIINASVYSYHDIVRLLRDWRFVQTAQCDKRVRTKVLNEELFGDAIKYVITHEIGHCLGFMHNMCASAAIPTDSLRSPSFTQKYGTTYSVMDYARFNYVAQPGDMERGVKLTPPSLGIYDFYSIKWLYTPIYKAKTPKEEIPVLKKWISEKAGNPIYRYGKQQLRYDYDPSSLTEDLGDDVIKSSNYGIKNLKYIMKNFNNWVKDEDEDLSFRNDLYMAILHQYARYLKHALTNIGGIYMNETYEGDPYDKCVAVPKAKQKAALQFLLKQIRENAWIENKDNNKYLELDVPREARLSKNIYKALFTKIRSVRFSGYKAKSAKEEYTVEEYFNDIYKETWNSLLKGKKLNATMKSQQNIFIDHILKESKLVTEQSNKRSFMVGGIAEPTNSYAKIDLLGEEEVNYYEGEFDTNGFGFTSKKRLDDIEIDPSLYYGYVLKIKSLIERNRSKVSASDRLHYDLLLMKIKRAVKL